MTEKQKKYIDTFIESGATFLSNGDFDTIELVRTGHERMREMMDQISNAIGAIHPAEKTLLAATYRKLADVHHAMLTDSEKNICDDYVSMSKTVAIERRVKRN